MTSVELAMSSWPTQNVSVAVSPTPATAYSSSSRSNSYSSSGDLAFLRQNSPRKFSALHDSDPMQSPKTADKDLSEPHIASPLRQDNSPIHDRYNKQYGMDNHIISGNTNTRGFQSTFPPPTSLGLSSTDLSHNAYQPLRDNNSFQEDVLQVQKWLTGLNFDETSFVLFSLLQQTNPQILQNVFTILRNKSETIMPPTSACNLNMKLPNTYSPAPVAHIEPQESFQSFTFSSPQRPNNNAPKQWSQYNIPALNSNEFHHLDNNLDQLKSPIQKPRCNSLFQTNEKNRNCALDDQASLLSSMKNLNFEQAQLPSKSPFGKYSRPLLDSKEDARQHISKIYQSNQPRRCTNSFLFGTPDPHYNSSYLALASNGRPIDPIQSKRCNLSFDSGMNTSTPIAQKFDKHNLSYKSPWLAKEYSTQRQMTPNRSLAQNSSFASNISTTSSHSQRNKPDPIQLALSNNISGFLKALRLHKYTNNLQDLSWQELVSLTDEDLEERGVTAFGARRKMLRVFQSIKEAASSPTEFSETSELDNILGKD